MTEKEFVSAFPKAFEKGKNFILSRYKIDYFSCEDILQNASLKAFKNYQSFEKRSSFDSWFISILINEIKSFFLSRKKEKIFDDLEIDLSKYHYTFEEPDIFRKEKEEFNSFVINKVLLKINKKQKKVIDLLLKENSHSEISKKLKIPINSVRTRAFYAKKALKKIISSYAFDSRS